MKVFQSSLFFRTIKRFKKNEKKILDNQIKKIVKNPQIGIQRFGVLSEVKIHKFKINNLQYLLAYRYKKDYLELIMIGPHENYYRDLQKNIL